ncbi:MAG: HAMP domain-containing histidine kinase [Idiomarina sp.]|nr:HAMP domain-containing histidine kinase [Idiomarina sp.]
MLIGLALTLLATLAFGSLLFQNIRVETLVAAKARQLKKTFRGLQRAQSQLVKQERMAALGSLVAGVAHELSTPVSNSMMAASVIVDRLKRINDRASQLSTDDLLHELQQLNEAATLVQQNAWRAGDLISSFKQVSIDQTSARRREFDLRKTVEAVLATLGPQLRGGEHHVDIRIPEPIDMNSYPGQLGQVLANLVLNAVVHGFSGRTQGTITVSAHRERCGMVEIIVADNGKGMSEQVRERVFEPFFTTRLGQGGSGLGLHIVYNIVDTVLGGKISVRSQPDHGSEFIIRVPDSAPETNVQKASAPSAESIKA